jgi:hypothetical protein
VPADIHGGGSRAIAAGAIGCGEQAASRAGVGSVADRLVLSNGRDSDRHRIAFGVTGLSVLGSAFASVQTGAWLVLTEYTSSDLSVSPLVKGAEL